MKAEKPIFISGIVFCVIGLVFSLYLVISNRDSIYIMGPPLFIAGAIMFYFVLIMSMSEDKPSVASITSTGNNKETTK